MAATIVHDATIITPHGERVDVLANHSLAFADGRVSELGPADDFKPRVAAAEFAEVIDGRSRLVIPGLVNTHHHLYQSLTRCLPAVQNANLFDWLLGLYEHWRNLDADAINTAAKVSLCELLLHGCTTTSDHHYMLPAHTDACIDAVVRAADELGVRIHVCRGSMTLGQSGGGLPPDDCVEDDADVMKDYERVLAEFHDARPHAMRRIDLAPCSPFNVTPELLRDTVTFARERGVLLHTHLAETVEEEAFCIEKYGCRPVQYMADLGWLGPDVYLAHCVQLNDDEIRLFAETNTAVAHCPTSNMRLGSGIALTRRLMDAGVRVGVAVDGSSSNDCGNLLAEARMALLAARVRGAIGKTADDAGKYEDGERGFFPATDAFRLATVGGAGVLCRDELGHLAPGSAADFAMFRTDDIALAGAAAQDPVAAMMLCDPPRADSVYVAGRDVVREGRITALDENKLAAEFNELVTRRFRRPT